MAIMSEIEFTQFFMPNGRSKPTIITRPDAIGEHANCLIATGCRLEIEMLTTGQISMTVEKDNEDGEINLLAHKVCNNGPEVPENVDELLTDAIANLENDHG